MLLKDYKLTQEEFSQIVAPLALDLQAYYNIMQEAILKMIDIGIEKGWTPEKLIQEISLMFQDGGNKYLHEEVVNKKQLSESRKGEKLIANKRIIE
ncbi:MAG: hypothetical protein ACM31H_01920 [Nitrososphaerales archaeon]